VRVHIVGDADARPPVAEDPYEFNFVVLVVRVPRRGQSRGPLERDVSTALRFVHTNRLPAD
jgi:hypothetical protein